MINQCAFKANMMSWVARFAKRHIFECNILYIQFIALRIRTALSVFDSRQSGFAFIFAGFLEFDLCVVLSLRITKIKPIETMEIGEGSIAFQDILEVTAREVKFCTFFDKIFRFPITFPKLLNEKRQNH